MKKSESPDERKILLRWHALLSTAGSSLPDDVTKDDVRPLLALGRKYHTLHEVGKLIASEMELNGLMTLALDKVIEVTRAERGFIALVDANGDLDFKVARNLEKSDIDKPHFQVSRTIIQNVVGSGQTICLQDAMSDNRFRGEESITRLRLLSVLCAPIKIGEIVRGLIYVDNSNIKNLFDEAIGDLVSTFSNQMAIALKNASLYSNLKQSHKQLAEELRRNYQFSEIIGSGEKMTGVLELVSNIADTDATVLVQGENGTGKELVARALHFNSSRREKPFVTINCSAIPDELIESELFGHTKGAFTGAVKDKRGKFEMANGGAVFLDEIGEMKASIQAKLLRVLEDGSYSPIGSEREKQCDVRIVAATNRDLAAMVREGEFREDLYYRLYGFTLTLPPLRERREDIPLLIHHFIGKHKTTSQPPDMSKAVEQLLLDYTYPGNVRQLDRIVQRAVVLCKGKRIEVSHLPEDVISLSGAHAPHDKELTYQQRKQQAPESWETGELKRILALTGGKVRKSARVAGMDVKNFSEKLKKFGIDAKRFK